jgi:GNAT superfamily N-acetyltransferase
MGPDDVAAAADVAIAAFGMDPDPGHRTLLRCRLRHCLESDPDGAYVGLERGRVAAIAQAIRREGVWVLSLLAVDPGAQSAGLGRALLEAAAGYREPGDRGVIASSSDPRALALYGHAGFALHPAVQVSGSIDLTAMPADLPAVSDAQAEDQVLADISRAVRGAAHSAELPLIVARGARIMRLEDRGYAVATPGSGVWMVAARDEPAATALLWHALAAVGASEGAVIRWITAPQQWALAVALRAGLRLEPYGALCLRGYAQPPSAYIPSAAYG